MTTETYDTKPPLPGLEKEPDKRPPLPGLEKVEPIKKKEAGKTSSTDGRIDAATGLKYFDITTKQKAQYEDQNEKARKALGIHEETAPEINDDPIGHVLSPFAQKAANTFADVKLFGNQNRLPGESTSQSTISNPFLKQNKSKTQSDVLREHDAAATRYNEVADKVIETVFPDGEAAENYLKNQFQKRNGQLPENNQTVNIAIQKAANLEGLRKGIEDSQGDLTQAAMNMARDNDQFLNEQISSLEKNSGLNGRMGGINEYKNIVPNALQGRYVDQLIHDKDVDVLAKRDPELKSQLDHLRNGGLYEEFPDYAIAKFSNEISRQREAEGGNNLFANPIFNSSTYLDKLADRMYKNDPVALDFINKNLKGKWQGKIDTPGFLDEFGTAGKQTFQGIGGTVKDIFGQGDSNAERVYNELEKQNTAVSGNPTGVHKFIGTAGNFLGMVGAMGATSPFLRGAGLSAEAVNKVLVPATFYDQEKNEWAAKYPNEPWKANLGAIASTGAFALAPDIFPNKKIANTFQKNFSETVSDALEKVQGDLTNMADREKIAAELTNKFGSTFKEAAKGTVKGAAEMLAINQFKAGLDHYLGLNEQEYNRRYNNDATLDIARTMLIGGALPHYLGAKGSKNAAAESLYSISLNPDRYKDALMDAKLSPEEMAKKRSDIDYLSGIRKQLDDNDVSIANQKRYLLEALQEKNLKDQAAATPDATLSKPIEKKIQQHQQVKEQILEGKTPSPLPKDESLVIDQPEQKQLTDQEAKVIDLIKDKPDISKTAMGKFLYDAAQDPSNHSQIIKELVDQSSDPEALEMNVGKKVTDAVLGLPEKSKQKTAEEIKTGISESGKEQVVQAPSGEIIKSLDDAAQSKKSVREKNKAMEAEAGKYGEKGQRALLINRNFNDIANTLKEKIKLEIKCP